MILLKIHTKRIHMLVCMFSADVHVVCIFTYLLYVAPKKYTYTCIPLGVYIIFDATIAGYICIVQVNALYI